MSAIRRLAINGLPGNRSCLVGLILRSVAAGSAEEIPPFIAENFRSTVDEMIVSGEFAVTGCEGRIGGSGISLR